MSKMWSEKSRPLWIFLITQKEILQLLSNNSGLSPSSVVLCYAIVGGEFYGYHQRTMVRQRDAV